jgi:DNA-binding HxlR family transcriptional regulator
MMKFLLLLLQRNLMKSQMNRPYDVFSPLCPSRWAFDHIFNRWGILTLARLSQRPVRFGVLCREVGGISEKMLAQTLKVLEEEGLVLRQEWNEKPPRVEYSLTEGGARISRSITKCINELYAELDRHTSGSSDPA